MSGPPPPLQVTRVFEVALYAADLDAMADFYTRVLGLEVITRFGDRGFALRCGGTALLVFDPARTRDDEEMVPKHGSTGAGHVAFPATAEELPQWREHLAACGIPIEREVTWPSGGTSLYVRDPAGNSVELAPPTLWGGLGFDAVAGSPPSRERLVVSRSSGT
jgi:catechol-2,3-dioxygenase